MFKQACPFGDAPVLFSSPIALSLTAHYRATDLGQFRLDKFITMVYCCKRCLQAVIIPYGTLTPS